MGLSIAVTGPTGEIGISAVDALERDPKVQRIVGMARRPFDPAAHGWTKTSYHQGDILDRDAVEALVADADVVVHLAFIIMGSREESAHINLEGTRNVFEATVRAVRPCIVAGPKAPALANAMPWSVMPGPLGAATRALLPIPDPGVPMQLVHHDDVATAIALAVTTSAPPGAYNIAADGTISISDVISSLGGHAVRVPHVAAIAASAVVARLPFVPGLVEWLHAVRAPVVMDTTKAKTVLGWTPKYSSAQTLEALAQSR
jgi:nucleoside-diphosphate-sugar epimerase